MIVRKRHSDINIYKETFSFQKIFEKVIIKDTSNNLYRIVAVCHLRPEKCFCKQNGPFFISSKNHRQKPNFAKESETQKTKDSGETKMEIKDPVRHQVRDETGVKWNFRDSEDHTRRNQRPKTRETKDSGDQRLGKPIILIETYFREKIFYDLYGPTLPFIAEWRVQTYSSSFRKNPKKYFTNCMEPHTPIHCWMAAVSPHAMYIYFFELNVAIHMQNPGHA